MNRTLTPKSTNRAPHKRIARGKPIPIDKIIKANSLYFDQGWSIHKVVREGKISMSVAERALFFTKQEWESFKQSNKQNVEVWNG